MLRPRRGGISTRWSGLVQLRTVEYSRSRPNRAAPADLDQYGWQRHFRGLFGLPIVA